MNSLPPLNWATRIVPPAGVVSTSSLLVAEATTVKVRLEAAAVRVGSATSCESGDQTGSPSLRLSWCCGNGCHGSTAPGSYITSCRPKLPFWKIAARDESGDQGPSKVAPRMSRAKSGTSAFTLGGAESVEAAPPKTSLSG